MRRVNEDLRGSSEREAAARFGQVGWTALPGPTGPTVLIPFVDRSRMDLGSS